MFLLGNEVTYYIIYTVESGYNDFKGTNDFTSLYP